MEENHNEPVARGVQDYLAEIASLCYEISTKSKMDVFFSYYPHVNGITISYYPNGWYEGEKAKYLVDFIIYLDTACLPDVIDKLIELGEEVVAVA